MFYALATSQEGLGACRPNTPIVWVTSGIHTHVYTYTVICPENIAWNSVYVSGPQSVVTESAPPQLSPQYQVTRHLHRLHRLWTASHTGHLAYSREPWQWSSGQRSGGDPPLTRSTRPPLTHGTRTRHGTGESGQLHGWHKSPPRYCGSSISRSLSGWQSKQNT